MARALTCPGLVHRLRVSWIHTERGVISLLGDSPKKRLSCSFMDLARWGEREEGEDGRLSQSEEKCLRVSQQGDFQIEAPGLGVQLCLRAWPARGPECLTAALSRRCPAPAVSHIWRGWLSPMKPAMWNLCNCL